MRKNISSRKRGVGFRTKEPTTRAEKTGGRLRGRGERADQCVMVSDCLLHLLFRRQEVLHYMNSHSLSASREGNLCGGPAEMCENKALQMCFVFLRKVNLGGLWRGESGTKRTGTILPLLFGMSFTHSLIQLTSFITFLLRCPTVSKCHIRLFSGCIPQT